MEYTYKCYDFDNPSLLFKLEDFFKGFLGFLLYHPFISLFKLKGNEQVLDFGCGGGAGAKYIIRKLNENGFVIGTDLSEYWIKRARKRLKKYENVKCLQGDIRDLAIADKSHDVISIVHVIHDIPPEQRQKIVQTLAEKLKAGGNLFIYEPTRPSHGMSVEEIKSLMTKAGLKEMKSIVKKTSYMGQFSSLF